MGNKSALYAFEKKFNISRPRLHGFACQLGHESRHTIRLHGQVRATGSKSVVKPPAICCHQASCQVRSPGLLRLDDTFSVRISMTTDLLQVVVNIAVASCR